MIDLKQPDAEEAPGISPSTSQWLPIEGKARFGSGGISG